MIRQGSFIQKMHDIDWLHSPEITSTMTHLCLKYTRFFHIMAAHPTKLAVPTLDVDLAWHTHQLTPSAYHAHSTLGPPASSSTTTTKSPKTVSPPPSPGPPAPTNPSTRNPTPAASAGTAPPSAPPIPTPFTRLLRRASLSAIDAALSTAPPDPDKAPHISAHSAIRPATDATGTAYARAKACRWGARERSRGAAAEEGYVRWR